MVCAQVNAAIGQLAGLVLEIAREATGLNRTLGIGELNVAGRLALLRVAVDAHLVGR